MAHIDTAVSIEDIEILEKQRRARNTNALLEMRNLSRVLTEQDTAGQQGDDQYVVWNHGSDAYLLEVTRDRGILLSVCDPQEPTATFREYQLNENRDPSLVNGEERVIADLRNILRAQAGAVLHNLCEQRLGEAEAVGFMIDGVPCAVHRQRITQGRGENKTETNTLAFAVGGARFSLELGTLVEQIEPRAPVKHVIGKTVDAQLISLIRGVASGPPTDRPPILPSLNPIPPTLPRLTTSREYQPSPSHVNSVEYVKFLVANGLLEELKVDEQVGNHIKRFWDGSEAIRAEVEVTLLDSPLKLNRKKCAVGVYHFGEFIHMEIVSLDPTYNANARVTMRTYQTNTVSAYGSASGDNHPYVSFNGEQAASVLNQTLVGMLQQFEDGEVPAWNADLQPKFEHPKFNGRDS